jgi:hypothetical protein
MALTITAPSDKSREFRAGQVGANLSGRPPNMQTMTAPRWAIAPGEDRIRKEIHGNYGGSSQNGISVSARTPNILVYSDHEKASQNGYDFDGWDMSRELFYYTGEGRLGNQEFTNGNAAILDHKKRQLALRLFVAIGNVPGTGTRIHRYVGQFEVDPELPYIQRTAPGADGAPRNVIVFRLRPIGEIHSEVAQTSPIEGAVAAATVEQIDVNAIPLAAITAEQSEFHRAVSGTVTQTEASLVERFQTYLETAHNRVVERYKIQTPVGVLYTDAADTTANILYEAKGTAERMSVRLALGQVLDYGRYVKHCALAVLLPNPPDADLIELLESHNVGCVVEGNFGQFSDMTSLGRCP